MTCHDGSRENRFTSAIVFGLFSGVLCGVLTGYIMVGAAMGIIVGTCYGAHRWYRRGS